MKDTKNSEIQEHTWLEHIWIKDETIRKLGAHHFFDRHYYCMCGVVLIRSKDTTWENLESSIGDSET